MENKTTPYIPVSLGGVEESFNRDELAAVAEVIAALSPDDCDLLAAVQESPYRLTAPEQFKEFSDNIDYFVFEPNIHRLDDLGWSYLAQHMDILLPPELLDAIDPVPFGKHAMEEDHGCFTHYGYLMLSGDEWQHEKPLQQEAGEKPSIRERLEQGKKKYTKQTPPHDRVKFGPEL